jgi:hypothetical protein
MHFQWPSVAILLAMPALVLTRPLATQMPSKAVAVKTEARQAILALHRIRQQQVKFRTMQMNGLRGC